MNDAFSDLINDNEKQIEEILTKQSLTIFEVLKKTVAEIKEHVDQATKKTEAEISTSQHQVAATMKNILLGAGKANRITTKAVGYAKSSSEKVNTLGLAGKPYHEDR